MTPEKRHQHFRQQQGAPPAKIKKNNFIQKVMGNVFIVITFVPAWPVLRSVHESRHGLLWRDLIVWVFFALFNIGATCSFTALDRDRCCCVKDHLWQIDQYNSDQSSTPATFRQRAIKRGFGRGTEWRNSGKWCNVDFLIPYLDHCSRQAL